MQSTVIGTVCNLSTQAVLYSVLLLIIAMLPTTDGFVPSTRKPGIDFVKGLRIIPDLSSATLLAATTNEQKEDLPSRKKKNNHEKWQPYYDALRVFQNKYGHCNVPEIEDPALYQWIDEQYSSYRNMKLGRKTKLTKKRAVALEMIGAIPAELLDM